MNKACMHSINSCMIIFTYDSIKTEVKLVTEFGQPPGGAVDYCLTGPVLKGHDSLFKAQCFMRPCCVQTKPRHLIYHVEIVAKGIKGGSLQSGVRVYVLCFVAMLTRGLISFLFP